MIVHYTQPRKRNGQFAESVRFINDTWKRTLPTSRVRKPRYKTIYKAKKVFKYERDMSKVYRDVSIIFGVIALILLLGFMSKQKPLITPCPTTNPGCTPQIMAMEPIIEPRKNVDTIVGDAVDYFFKNPVDRSEMRMTMHCLLDRESKHGNSTGKGDGGLASGPLQFHEATWIRMRNQMIKAKLITEIGDRNDMEDAVFTTVWAIKNGRILEWGPSLRWAQGKYTKYTCQVPSLTTN